MSQDWNKKLMSAIHNCHLNTDPVEHALNNGADVNTEVDDKWTPLSRTIYNRRYCYNTFPVLKLLVCRGANINKICNAEWGKGNTALALCVREGLEEFVKYLIGVGANVCKVGKEGKTPLSWAVINKSINMIELLLDHGAHFTIPSAFLEAIKLNNLEMVKILISKRANVNHLYKNGYTPLTKSLEVVDGTAIVKELIENGADVNTPDFRGDYSLIKSLNSGRFDIALLCVERGATTNTPDALKNFPLIKSTELGSLELVKALVEKGTDLKITDKLGRTPFMIALQEDHFEIVKYFVQQGEDVNQIFSDKETPLSIAATNLNYQMFQFLVESGADLNLAKTKIQEIADEDFDVFMQTTFKGGKNTDKVEFLGSSGQEDAL